MKTENLIKLNIKYLKECIEKLEIELCKETDKPYLTGKQWNYRLTVPKIDGYYTIPDKDFIPSRFVGMKVTSNLISWQK